MVAAPLKTGVARLALATLAGVALAAGATAMAGAMSGPPLGLAEAWAEPPRGGYPPDPPSTPSTRQWLFDVRVDKGKVSIDRARSITTRSPQPTARVMGRYALELWVGTELLDRVRFNVPLGADLPREDDGRPFRRPSFDKVTTRFTVQIADQPRAAYAKLVDRATGDETRFLWPPRGEVLEPIAAPPAKAPKRDAGAPPKGAPPKDGAGPPKGGAGPPKDGGAPPNDGAGPPKDGGAPPKDGGAPPAGDQQPRR
jgi:hypothetical protein